MAHLVREIRSHYVHVARQILQGTRYALQASLKWIVIHNQNMIGIGAAASWDLLQINLGRNDR